VRIVLVIASLAAAAFLVVQERGARAAADIGTTALAPTGVPSAQQVAATRAKLPTAERWNPDTTPRVDIGVLEVRAKQYRAAGADFAAVTREEPDNAQAWSLLAFAAQRYDSGLAAKARARARALEPPVPPAR
jgi:Tfp pilus assembly protein PilF